MAQSTDTPIYDIELKCNSLILHIKQNNKETFIFENALDKACEKWLQDNKSQKELDKLIKKQDGKYYIFKPLIVKYENIDTNTESKESQNDTESKRKIIYAKDEISFKNCVFCGEVRFEYISFGALDSIVDKETESNNSLRIDFQRCEFKERVYFTNCEFNGNVFFNHAVFHKYADFHESIFNGIVSFYNATFKSAPNFSTCVFSNLQATNFINVKINGLEFAEIKNFISEYRNDKTYKKEIKLSKEKQETIKKHKIRYANNARDSFRTIKNVLIANNNLLDASIWHKLELYAKEIELRLPEPESINNQNNKYKKWIDLIQLCFYRHTSAHHTDLLKILSWFVVLVGGFATILFFIKDLNSIALWGSIFAVTFISLLFMYLFKKINCFGFFTLLNLVPCVWLLTWNPKYIFGVANLFGNDTNQNNISLNLILSLYSILFILVIFSLQKTARKNSIIPN